MAGPAAILAPRQTDDSGGYDGYASNAVDADGGASGTSYSTFNVSKGGLIAIIVVIVTVAIFGSKSTIQLPGPGSPSLTVLKSPQ